MMPDKLQQIMDKGLHGMGAGFLIKGKARFVLSGPDFDFMKEKLASCHLGRDN